MSKLVKIVNSGEKVQLSRISHVYQSHTDLAAWGRFAEDFGLVEAARDDDAVFYRGYGRDPYCVVASKSTTGRREFGGAAFVAKSLDDFEKAKLLPGAYLKDLADAPGGGKMVSIPTPTGNLLHVIWGQEERPVSGVSISATVNDDVGPLHLNKSIDKPRLGEFQRFQPGPAPVHKLGHFGYITKDFDNDVDFYTTNFNFVPSDVLTSPSTGEDNACFFHLDLGADYSDHHSLFLIRAPFIFPETRMHHTSYEVNDFDTQLLGHDWLLSCGYKLIWGVGRHILGSQIFDYWRDPSGFIIEHYTDGDLVNNTHRVTREPDGGSRSLAIWGPAFNERLFSGLSTFDLLKVLLKLPLSFLLYVKAQFT